jgi:hypothetical protein
LQKGLEKHLNQVRVYLVWDANGEGEAFLWIIPETEYSPYHNSMMNVLSKGEAFLRDHLFRFDKADLKKKACGVPFKARTPDDPAPILPARPISALLPEALKQEHIISSKSHPVYVSLTSGGRL